jgi:hypothetical protein
MPDHGGVGKFPYFTPKPEEDHGYTLIAGVLLSPIARTVLVLENPTHAPDVGNVAGLANLVPKPEDHG